jgi:uncharacterized protein with von Willebrand factor type A (vWA) domain
MTKQDLTKYDFILLLDKSGSMGTADVKGKTRWAAAEEATLALARKCVEFDQNGITVIPFAGKFKMYENIDGGEDKVRQIFHENEPNGSTDTAGALKHVLDEYISSRGSANCKPIIVLVITDGEPDSKPALAKVIVDATKKIDNEEEIGITFVQVGQDQNARTFLKELDDDLVNEGAKFDIVDTVTMEEMEDMSLVDVLLNAILD